MFRYDLYDEAGRLLMHQEAALLNGSEEQRLNLSTLATGQYHLQVTWLQNGQISAAAYKIQKLH